jgi:hypothetical protein
MQYRVTIETKERLEEFAEGRIIMSEIVASNEKIKLKNYEKN